MLFRENTLLSNKNFAVIIIDKYCTCVLHISLKSGKHT